MARLRGLSLVDQAEEEISRRIDVGELKPGDRLSIARFAKEFGTSVVPIREAMARLHSKRVLSFQPNKGYAVAPHPGAMEISRMMDARLALELGALEVAFQYLVPDDVAELRKINAEVRGREFDATVEGYRAFVKLNERFHMRLIGIAGNEFLTDAYESIGFHRKITRALRGRRVHDIATLAAEHEAIIDAMERGDKAACRDHLGAHIIDSYARLRASGALDGVA